MATEAPTEPFVELPIECIYRTDVRREHGYEFATCRLLQMITRLEAERCAVDRSACEVCSRTLLSAGARLNPVLPSLLYQVCLPASPVEQTDSTDTELRHLQRIRRWAAQNVHRPFPPHRSTPGCDVVVFCSEDHRFVNEAVESALAQVGVVPIVHLIDDATEAARIAHWERHPQIRFLRNREPLGWHRTLQRLIPDLTSSFLAIQDPDCVSRPDRLATAINQLDEWGGELFGSAVSVGREIVDARFPEKDYRRFLPRETLVFRRASLVDMGGFADRADADAELVYRAQAESRRVAVSPLPLVDRLERRPELPLDRPPVYSNSFKNRRPSSGTLRECSMGFPTRPVACDVVLPFYDHVDFVREAIESLFAQVDAELVVHLVDDAGPVGDEVIRRYSGTSNVRCYRNSKNIGPFATFNNIASFAETELIAVQDADDISRMNRMVTSANWLRLAGADIFGGRCTTFGSETIIFPSSEEANDRIPHRRPKSKPSTYPRPGGNYFLENPTAMMRTEAFRMLGGYANFRQRERNRTGVDTEFFARAYFCEQRFVVTQDVVVDYRVHPASATQSRRTGWGSRARAEAVSERRRRIELYCSAERFDPRLFGALDDFKGITQPFSSKTTLT